MGPHVDFKNIPKEACQAVQAAGFPIETDLPTVGAIAPSHAGFMEVCEKIFQGLVQARQQGNPKKDPQVWTSPLIRSVQDYAVKYQIPVKVSFEKPEGLSSPLKVSRNTLYLDAIPPNSFTLSTLAYALDHERGHLRDYKLIGELLPDSKPFFDKELLALPEFMVLIFAFLLVMEKKLDFGEQRSFNVVRAEALKNFEDLTLDQAGEVYTVITELFRWGEEIYDPRFKSSSLNEQTFARYRKEPSGSNQPEENSFGRDFAFAALTASLQEADLWEKITKRKDFNPEKVKRLDPRIIEFCRLAIRASSRYFQKK